MHTGKKVTTFKERICDLFNESPLSDVEIARSLKVSKQTVSAWKIGTRSPKEPTIIAIAQHFHVNPEWLMGFDVDKDSSVELHKDRASVFTVEDSERLEALHQNPRLGLLFDRATKMSKDDVEFMMQMADRILKERDGE